MPKQSQPPMSVKLLLALILAAAPAAIKAQPLEPAAPPQPAQTVEPSWIPFKTNPGDSIIIPITVNGAEVKGLLETGTPMVIIDRQLAVDLKVTLSPEVELEGLSGKVPVEEGRLTSLKVGLFDGKDIDVEVTDLARTRPLTGEAFSVILGARFFSWAAMQVDFDHAVLRFLPSGAASGGVAVAEARLDPVSKKIMTSIEINGQRIDRVEIGTAQPSALRLSPRIWARVRLKTARVTDIASADLTGIAVSPYTIVPEVKIGDHAVRDVTTIIDPDHGGVLEADHANALIGLELLRHFNLVLDVPQGKLLMAERQKPDPPARKSTAGVQGIYGDDGFQILHVMRQSPAERAGLKVGDRICAVDRARVDAAWAGHEKSTWSLGAVGRRVELTLCSGEMKTLTLAEFY